MSNFVVKLCISTCVNIYFGMLIQQKFFTENKRYLEKMLKEQQNEIIRAISNKK